ncbi:MAG: SH3 domain-containing protein [Proteobacteria bacterium]|nr:SH3 domain-containing protein [Pseudomonadota bacterium]
MKIKMIVMVTLIAFTLGCGAVEKFSAGVKERFSENDKPVTGETQQEEVFKPEPESEEAVSQVAHQEVEPTPETVGPLTQIVSVRGSVVNIRSGPGTTNKVIAKVRRGDELEVMGETLSWYNVKLSSGVEGWIYKKLVR